jgi:ribosomal protein L11 methyltransferase
MNWQQVNCLSTRLEAEAISLFFETFGALSVTYQDAKDEPILEPLPGETPLWDSINITALYDEEYDLTTLPQTLKTTFPNTQKIIITPLQDQQWERAWMDDYHPMKFGERLWIYPTHYQRPNDDSVQVLLDPGLAFGTGTHPTTALCLEWLDQHPPENLTLIDYGCGSGVLAIAAIKLGAKHVIATDIDEQALIATEENRKTNHIDEQKISICLPPHLNTPPLKQVDGVLANILSGPLCELAPMLAAFIKPQGIIVLSGILATQKQFIIDAYSPFFNNINCDHHDEWLRITGTRKNR